MREGYVHKVRGHFLVSDVISIIRSVPVVYVIPSESEFYALNQPRPHIIHR